MAALTAPDPELRARPRVLFVGSDATSPQIAASLLRRAVGDRVVVGTADTQPVERGGRTDEMLVGMGLDPAPEHLLTAASLRTADRVVVLGTDLDVALLPGPRYDHWDLAADDLAERVEALAAELTGPPPPGPWLRLRHGLRVRLERLRQRLPRRTRHR